MPEAPNRLPLVRGFAASGPTDDPARAPPGHRRRPVSQPPTLTEIDIDLTQTIDRLHAAEITHNAAEFLLLAAEVDVLLELRWLIGHADDGGESAVTPGANDRREGQRGE